MIFDNIYEILQQRITYFTQHIKMFYTAHVTNLYNIRKKLYNI